MLVIRCIRPDRVVAAISNFVAMKLGEKFINPPEFDLKSIYADSLPTTPLIFVLSAGAAPFAVLKAFADSKRKEIVSKSLGKG
jgi:dynein heavy chain